MDLGKKLKELRNSYNLTQTKLTNILKISRVNYTRYENNQVRPDYETIIKIADYYDITLDELVNNKRNKKTKQIKKIVLTGGPCAGKTTAMNWIQNYFQKQGYKVLFVPEGATNLITGGITPFETTTNCDFQSLLFDLQLNTERIYEESVKSINSDKILLVCDRGLLDNKAYMSKRDFNYILKNMI